MSSYKCSMSCVQTNVFFKKRALKTEIKKEFTCEVGWGKKPNVETKHIFRSVLELDYLDVKMCFIWVSWTEGNLSCTFWINEWSLYSGVVWNGRMVRTCGQTLTSGVREGNALWWWATGDCSWHWAHSVIAGLMHSWAWEEGKERSTYGKHETEGFSCE